ncbi:MAG: ABC transporter substrate-binding protein, partial [Anaerococcus sp.]|nr:ABC transporter substrate-binding protein [Anaerococcus sp.]
MKKRNIFVSLALAGLLLTSCGNADKKENTETNDKPLKVAMYTEIDSLDPFNATAGDTKTIMDQVFDGLFDVDEDGNLVPDL